MDWHAKHTSLHVQRFAGGKKGINVQLLRHHTDIRPHLSRITIKVSPPDIDHATGFDHRTGQNIDQRRFARAIRPQQSKNTACRYPQRHITQGMFCSGFAMIDFVQMTNRHRRAMIRRRYIQCIKHSILAGIDAIEISLFRRLCKPRPKPELNLI